MHTLVLVADESEANFYEMERHDGALHLLRQLTDPAARLHDRDFKSDRPGRVFDHAPSATGRRGAVSHHGTGGERTPKDHEAHLFAHQVSEQLEKDVAKQHFDRLILMAAPRFLGALREALPDSIRSLVKAEVHKDLVHQPVSAVREHLPNGVD